MGQTIGSNKGFFEFVDIDSGNFELNISKKKHNPGDDFDLYVDVIKQIHIHVKKYKLKKLEQITITTALNIFCIYFVNVHEINWLKYSQILLKKYFIDISKEIALIILYILNSYPVVRNNYSYESIESVVLMAKNIIDNNDFYLETYCDGNKCLDLNILTNVFYKLHIIKLESFNELQKYLNVKGNFNLLQIYACYTTNIFRDIMFMYFNSGEIKSEIINHYEKIHIEETKKEFYNDYKIVKCNYGKCFDEKKEYFYNDRINARYTMEEIGYG